MKHCAICNVVYFTNDPLVCPEHRARLDGIRADVTALTKKSQLELDEEAAIAESRHEAVLDTRTERELMGWVDHRRNWKHRTQRGGVR